MNSSHLLRSCVLFASTIVNINRCPVIAQEHTSGDRALLGAGAAFVAVPCGKQPGDPRLGDCYEVFAENLKTIPLVIEIGLGTRENGPRAVLWTDRHRWSDFLEIVVAESDAGKTLKFDIVQSSERLSVAEVVGNASAIRSVEGIPKTLDGSGGVSVLAMVSDADGSPLRPGVYKFHGRIRSGGADFLGSDVAFNVDFTVSVKPSDDVSHDAVLEQSIERHYLWGTALQLRGMAENEEVLKRGLELAKAYIDKGAGDQNEVYNVTPRYQAAQLLMRMGQKGDAIAFLQRAYVQGAAAKECRWRPYLFLPDGDGDFEGPMPQHVKDVIYRVLQRLYMEEYGRPIHAVPMSDDGER